MSTPERYEGTRTVRTPYGERTVEYPEFLDLTRAGLIQDQDTESKTETKREAPRGRQHE